MPFRPFNEVVLVPRPYHIWSGHAPSGFQTRLALFSVVKVRHGLLFVGYSLHYSIYHSPFLSFVVFILTRFATKCNCFLQKWAKSTIKVGLQTYAIGRKWKKIGSIFPKKWKDRRYPLTACGSPGKPMPMLAQPSPCLPMKWKARHFQKMEVRIDYQKMEGSLLPKNGNKDISKKWKALCYQKMENSILPENGRLG